MTTHTGNRIGYARVSTEDQHLALQLDALNDVGCIRVFCDQASGSLRDRPQLTAMMDYLRPGDTLVTWRLDRLGRSLRHLIDIVNDLADRNVGLISLQESIDTTTATGRMLFHMMGALSQFERELVVERTRAGLSAARARGRVGGRPRALTPEKLKAARSMYLSGDSTVAAIARTVGVSRATLYRHLSIASGAPVGGPSSRPAGQRAPGPDGSTRACMDENPDETPDVDRKGFARAMMGISEDAATVLERTSGTRKRADKRRVAVT
jgi:DNA invertase Pin-like site-specific DNA recombinase